MSVFYFITPSSHNTTFPLKVVDCRYRKESNMDKTEKFIQEHLHSNPADLALRASKYQGIDLTRAIRQINGRQIVRKKIPSWSLQENLLYPGQLSMEQCSSEITARYKSLLVAEGDSLTDLTGGLGVDCAFMATHFKKVTYVEVDKELAGIAKHNYRELHLDHITVLNTNSIEYLRQMDPVDVIYIDPGRRDNKGEKVVALSDCEPNVIHIEKELLAKARIKVMVKLSPMLDIKKAVSQLTSVTTVHIVSVQNECKEMLLILGKQPHEDLRIHCVNLCGTHPSEIFSFSLKEEAEALCHYTSEIKNYLYEPNVSLLKAGAFKTVAHVYQLEKLHPNSHLYTSDQLVQTFSGRIFKVESYFSPGKKEVKRELSSIGKAHLTIRNFPAEVSSLRKQFKLKEGGDTYLFATTLANEKKVLIRCSKLQTSPETKS